jgi:hypothetical protein
VGGHRSCGPGLSVARVTAVDRDRYLVHDDEGETAAELTGRFLHAVASPSGMPCVGDRVVALSSVTGDGLDEVRALPVPGNAYCLLGSSGVGNSSSSRAASFPGSACRTT